MSRAAFLGYLWTVFEDLKMYFEKKSRAISQAKIQSKLLHRKDCMSQNKQKRSALNIYGCQDFSGELFELKFDWMIALDFSFMLVFKYLKMCQKYPRYMASWAMSHCSSLSGPLLPRFILLRREDSLIRIKMCAFSSP